METNGFRWIPAHRAVLKHLNRVCEFFPVPLRDSLCPPLFKNERSLEFVDVDRMFDVTANECILPLPLPPPLPSLLQVP